MSEPKFVTKGKVDIDPDTGVITDHEPQCGGPQQSCMIPGCKECGFEVKASADMACIDYKVIARKQAVKIESMREALEMVKPIIEGLDLTHRSSETYEMLNAVYRAIKEESE